MKVKLQVSIQLTDPAFLNELKAYVREAIKGWGGQDYPDSPFFPTNIKKVTVKTIKEK